MKKIIYFLFPALVFVLSTHFSVSTAQGLTEVKDSIYSDILQEQRIVKSLCSRYMETRFGGEI